jgi:hypothetical protein
MDNVLFDKVGHQHCKSKRLKTGSMKHKESNVFLHRVFYHLLLFLVRQDYL